MGQRRTLLIEEIAPDKENLVSMLAGTPEQKSFSDEQIQQLHQVLEVSSFEEVIRKFEPKIYMSLDTDNFQVTFQKEVPLSKNCFKSIPLYGKETFLQAVLELIEHKKKRKPMLTSFQDLEEVLLPTINPEEFFNKRENLIEEVKKGNEKRAQRILLEIVRLYDDGFFLLKTFLREVNTHLEEGTKEADSVCFVAEEDAQVQLLLASERFCKKRGYTKEEEKAYFAFLDKYLEEQKLKNRNLFLWLLKIPCKLGRKNLRLLEQYYSAYLLLYEKTINSFYKTAKPLLQTLLGIKNFFVCMEKEALKEQPILVISNCTSELLADNRHRQKFQLYLETVNEKQELAHSIQYALIPRLPFNGKKREYVRERFAANKQEYVEEVQNLEPVQMIAELLGSYRIHTFLSTIAVQDSSANALRRNGVYEFEAAFSFIHQMRQKEYVTPIYPNHTIFPKEYTHLYLLKETTYGELEQTIIPGNRKEVWLSEFMMEAVYEAIEVYLK